MKKILSIFSVVLFAFALTLSSCGESNADKASDECSADCAKACCLGCKATEGDKKCIKLEDGTMPCCVVSSDDEGGETEETTEKVGCQVEGGTCLEDHSCCTKTEETTEKVGCQVEDGTCLDDHSCCAANNDIDTEYPEDHGEEEDDDYYEEYEDDEEVGDWEPPGGNMERYMDLKDEGKSHEEAVEIMENEY